MTNKLNDIMFAYSDFHSISNNCITPNLNRQYITVLSLCVVVTSLVLVSCYNDNKQPTIVNTEIDTLRTLGNDISKSSNYLFGSPVAISVDSNSNIYIADNMSKKIKVFDDDGKFIRSIGREGRGPGEFVEIMDIDIVSDTLIVVGYNKVSWLTLNGKPLNSVTRYAYVGPLIPVSINEFISIDYERQYDDMVHVLNGEMDSLYSIASNTRVIGPQPIDRALASIGGDAAIVDSSTLVFSPYAYRGQMYAYSRVNGKWSFKREWRGYTVTEPFSRVPNNVQGASRLKRAGRENLSYVRNNMSNGLFKYEGYIIHFTTIRISTERQFGIEIYDNNGELLGYSPLSSIDMTENGAIKEPYPQVLAKSNDIFYVMERGFGTIPKIYYISLKLPSM